MYGSLPRAAVGAVAPIERVGAPWTPVPFGKVLVDAYVPKEDDIIQAVRNTQGALR